MSLRPPLSSYHTLCLIREILKIRKSFFHIPITEPDQFVFLQYILLCPGILASDTVKLLFFLIKKHIDIQVAHKAGRAAVI